MVIFIVVYGFIKKVDVYDTFIAMILAINLFVNSGFLDFVLSILKPVFDAIKFPAEVFPLALVRPISANASLAYLNNIFTTHGPDSFIGLLGSVMQGCTDTTFYVISLYFGSIGIKKIRYSLFAGLCADLIGIVASIVIVNLLWG